MDDEKTELPWFYKKQYKLMEYYCQKITGKTLDELFGEGSPGGDVKGGL